MSKHRRTLLMTTTTKHSTNRSRTVKQQHLICGVWNQACTPFFVRRTLKIQIWKTVQPDRRCWYKDQHKPSSYKVLKAELNHSPSHPSAVDYFGKYDMRIGRAAAAASFPLPLWLRPCLHILPCILWQAAAVSMLMPPPAGGTLTWERDKTQHEADGSGQSKRVGRLDPHLTGHTSAAHWDSAASSGVSAALYCTHWLCCRGSVSAQMWGQGAETNREWMGWQWSCCTWQIS